MEQKKYYSVEYTNKHTKTCIHIYTNVLIFGILIVIIIIII